MTSGNLEKIMKNKKVFSSRNPLEKDKIDTYSHMGYHMETFEIPEGKIPEVKYLQENKFKENDIEEIMYAYTLVEDMAEKQEMDFKDYLTDILISPAVPGSKEKTLEPLDFTRYNIECLINTKLKKDISNMAYFVLAMHCVGSEQYKEKTELSPRTEKDLHEVPVEYGLKKILRLAMAHQKADADLTDEINEKLSEHPKSYADVLGAFGLNEVEKEYTPKEDIDLAIENYII